MKKRSTVSSQRLTVCTGHSAICIFKHAAFFFFLLIFSSELFSQSVSASLDRDKILLGEQVTMQLNLSNVNEAFFVEAWPQVNDTINNTEIVKRTAIDTININGINTYRQNFTITSFDSGRWQLGPFIFIISDKTTGKKLQLQTAAVYITVLPVDVSSMKDYHPIKDIIDVDTSFNWTPVIIGAVIILIIIIVYIIIKNRKKKIAEPPKIILKGTPLERALEKLQALQNEPLTSPTTIKKFHSEIDNITRQYFEEMMHIKALQLTVSELFARINMYMQDVQLRKKFQEVFELNASVKFAKYMPAEDESKNTLKEIIKSLHQTDDFVNNARSNADKLVPKY